MLKEYCKLVNMPFIEEDLFEADDIIGSLCCNSSKHGLHSYAVTGDKDILQLIHRGIDILYLSNKGPINYGENELYIEYNICPDQYLDYKSLVGDPSDNIPGIPGIGKKTAGKLLGLYGSLDGIYENIHRLKGKQKENLDDNKDKVYMYKDILTIKCDMELDYDKYFKEDIEEGFDLENSQAKEFLKTLEIEEI